MNKYLSLILWVAVFEAVSGLIGYATRPAVDGWYAALARPSFTPPNAVFPVMWTLLYALIATVGWYLWRHRRVADGRQRLTLFAVYMGLNWTWSFVFFGMGQLFAGFVWILAINAVWLLLMYALRDADRRVLTLMLPVLLWTLFAAVLNGAFWVLN